MGPRVGADSPFEARPEAPSPDQGLALGQAFLKRTLQGQALKPQNGTEQGETEQRETDQGEKVHEGYVPRPGIEPGSSA